MRIRRLNKRGDIRTLAPTELVGYILGALVLVLVLMVAGIFTAFYFNEKEEEYAKNNFIALANKLEGLSKSQLQFEVQRAFPFYLPSDFIVVGFDREWNNYKESDGCDSERVRKPNLQDGKEGEKCISSACVCLFGDTNDDFMNDDGTYNVKLIQCRSIPDADYITTLDMGPFQYGYPLEVYKNLVGKKNGLSDYSQISFADYAFFYLYGQCDDYYLWSDKDIGSRKLYIEKFTDSQNKEYLFIAPEGSDKVDGRYDDMNKKYGKLAKQQYIDKIDKILDQENEAGNTNTYQTRQEAINYFISLVNYYGFIDELKPRLFRIASLYLTNPGGFRAKADPIIQNMNLLKISSEGNDKIAAQFFLSRLKYMQSTALSSRAALLEMQNLIENNPQMYKSAAAPASSCVDYDKKARKNEVDMDLLFKCSNQLLNRDYGMAHILVYAAENEEIKVDNYKIKIKKVKLAEEATIEIYKYNEQKRDYDLVKCNGKDGITLTITNKYFSVDEYNPEIENQGSKYSLNSLLQRCASQK